jgi:hypothetical protein
LYIDDSVNVCGKNQICIFIRFIDSDINTVTSFLALREIDSDGATANNLFNIICSTLKNFDININDMISFCSDGASNMRGNSNGLYQKFKNKIPNLIDYYCSNHRLNLAIQSTITNSYTVNSVVNSCSEASTYINNSSNRIFNIQKIQIENKNPIKKFLLYTPLRWSSLHDCINCITDQFLVILIFFNKEYKLFPFVNLQKLQSEFQNIDFIINLCSINIIMEKVDKCTKSFEIENVDVGSVNDGISNLILQLSSSELNEEILNLCYKLLKEYNKYAEITETKKKMKKSILI